MNNIKVKEIIKFSFFKNIQNKWFIIFNIISLLSIVISLNWSSFSTLFKPEDEETTFEIAFLDATNLVYENFISNLETLEVIENYNITSISENTYTAENIPDDFAIVEILPDEAEGFKASIISKEGINTEIYNPIKNALYQSRNELLIEKYQVESEELSILQSDLDINRVMLSVNAEDSNTKELIKLFSSALTYILTILIFSKMANEIAQEKQSKSSEYILTTVSAKEYLFAKIFSNIAILLIQGIFLFVYYFIAVSITNIIHISTTDITLSSGILKTIISLDTVLYTLALIAYSILNLILLCIIQATLSAKTSSTSEAGNTVSLLTFLMMAAYIATISIITPYTKVSPLLYVISCLPVLSAYFVPGMMIIGQATTLQIIISLIILVVSIPVSFHFCATSFKNGILDYTKRKRKNVKEINKDDMKKIFLIKRKMRNVGFVIGLSILLYIGIQSIISLLCSFILPTLLENYFTSTDITLINQIILQAVSLGLASFFVFAYCEKKDTKVQETIEHVPEKNTENLEETNITTPENLPSSNKSKKHEKLKLVFIGLFLMSALQILLSLIVYPALGLDYSITNMFEVDYNSSIITKVILILSLAVTPAIFEELFFRKAIIDFTAPYSKKFALLFSALLFGLLHMNLSQGLFAFLIGLVLGSIYLYTNDIKLPMLIHFINNGLAAVSMIVPEIGALFINLLLLSFVFIGFIFLIKSFIQKETRQKILSFFNTKYDFSSFKNKYIYMFTDFSFDVSLILVALMSFLTENILR